MFFLKNFKIQHYYNLIFFFVRFMPIINYNITLKITTMHYNNSLEMQKTLFDNFNKRLYTTWFNVYTVLYRSTTISPDFSFLNSINDFKVTFTQNVVNYRHYRKFNQFSNFWFQQISLRDLETFY